MKFLTSISVSVLFISVFSFADEKIALKEEKDRINYSVGYQLGGDFRRQGIELSPELLVKGIQDAVSETEPLMTPGEMNKTLVELKRKIVAAQREELRKKAEENPVQISAPAELRLRIVENGVQLDWKLSPEDPEKVTGYEIVRADMFSGPYLTVATIGKGVSRYLDTAAEPEHIYYYKVRAIAGNEFSSYSNTVAGERTGK